MPALRVDPVRKLSRQHQEPHDRRVRYGLGVGTGGRREFHPAGEQRRHEHVLLDRGAVKMRPLEILRGNERIAETFEMLGETHVARLHREFDAIAVGLTHARLRIVGQMQHVGLDPDAHRCLNWSMNTPTPNVGG